MATQDGKPDGDIEQVSPTKDTVDGSKTTETGEKADDILHKLPTRCQRFFAWDGALLVLSLVGAVVGFVIGFIANGAPSEALVWLGLPGELYMRMLKAAVLPLIVSSIITGTAGLKPKDNGKVSGVALTYIITTNIMGAIVGTLLAAIIRPGASGGADFTNNQAVDTGNLQTSDLFADLIRNFVPDNVVTACFQKSQTVYKPLNMSVGNQTVYSRSLGTSGGTNILGLVVVSAALGMAAAQQGEIALPFLNFFTAAAEVIMKLLHWMIWLTPVGVASLIAKAIGSSQDLVTVFRGLGLFVLAEVIGDVIIGLVIVPLTYLAFQRRNPLVFLLGASRSIITGLAASSSAVAMPEVLNCVETRHQVDHRVSRFVVPLATALNREGSAMFIACTCLYMAQTHGLADLGNTLLITILASVGSLAVPAVPSSSIITILMVLGSLDIPPANLGIIMALEWFSDRMRTAPNVISHNVAAIVTWKLCKDSLGFGSHHSPTSDKPERKLSDTSLHIVPDQKADDEQNGNLVEDIRL